MKKETKTADEPKPASSAAPAGVTPPTLPIVKTDDIAPPEIAGQEITEEMKDANLRFIAPVSTTNSFQTVVTGTPYTGPSIKTNGQSNPWATLGLEFQTKKGSTTSGAGTVDIKLQESNDQVTWTDVAAGAYSTIALSTTAGGGKYVLPFTSTTLYQRAVVTVGGTGGTVDIAGGIGTGVFPKTAYPAPQGV